MWTANFSTAKIGKPKKNQIKSNTEYWHKKIERNIQRDIEVNNYLKSQGWEVLRFWSTEVEKELDRCISVIQKAILS